MSRFLKWIFLSITLSLLTTVQIYAQKKFNVVFYNVENLFDTFNDPKTEDEEFLPQSQKHWTKKRFNEKLMNIYKALIAAGNGQFPDIIGFAEIENRWVLEQLIQKTPLNTTSYGIIHKESPDPRGIDVALLYRKETISPIDFNFIPVGSQGNDEFISRDILHFECLLGKEKINFFVNHWPSRSGGYLETQGKREVAAKILRNYLDTFVKDANILVMGDLNTTPNDKCLTSTLRAIPYPGNGRNNYLTNLSTLWVKKANGTLKYKDEWSIFDQIICSQTLLDNKRLKLVPSQSGICNFDFLLEPDTKYLGKKPFRTYLGLVYHGGTSDHLPVRVCFSYSAN